MKDLAQRLEALDPEASAALRVIAHFDRLSAAHASLSTIVREAAALAGRPVRLVDDRHLSIRVETDGAVRPAATAPDPDWPLATLPGEGTARMWLESPRPAGPVPAMVLERAAAAAAAVLHGAQDADSRPATGDRTYVDLVVDGTVAEPERLRAARRLGLAPDTLARAVAAHRAPPYVEVVPQALPAPYRNARAGIGPVVSVLNLPSSWADACVALRFTAEGNDLDPGPRTVAHEDLGGLALLAAAVGPTTQPVPDVQSLALVAAAAPWALSTLVAVAETDSLRAASAALRVHHSTLQYRLGMIERQLDWSVRDAAGRLRLHLALALRRLHHNAH
jgi:PucR C-terminal helix-turn-helix domain